jgi:chemotaxis signal transduction protein
MAEDASSRVGRRRFLIIRAGELHCALDLRSVRRVLRSLPVFPVPGAKAELLGLALWRGEPLAIVDLERVLEAQQTPRTNDRITVIVSFGTGKEIELLGLVVDEALDVVRIPKDEVTGSGTGLVVGEAVVGPQVVRVLDLGALGART